MIGLYGGSFDPVHQGHLQTALELQRRLPLADFRFLPAARSPLKGAGTPAADRRAMLELAIAGHPGLSVDGRELSRPGPSYTVDTLREIRAETGPEQPLVFIMGMDSLLELPRWKHWQELIRYAHLLVASRPGFRPDFSPELADWLKSVRTSSPELLQCQPAGLVLLLETMPWAIASRELRAAIALGLNMAQHLPDAVWEYVQSHQLYLAEKPQANESA